MISRLDITDKALTVVEELEQKYTINVLSGWRML